MIIYIIYIQYYFIDETIEFNYSEELLLRELVNCLQYLNSLTEKLILNIVQHLFMNQKKK